MSSSWKVLLQTKEVYVLFVAIASVTASRTIFLNSEAKCLAQSTSLLEVRLRRLHWLALCGTID